MKRKNRTLHRGHLKFLISGITRNLGHIILRLSHLCSDDEFLTITKAYNLLEDMNKSWKEKP